MFKSGEELKYTSIRTKWRDETKTVQIRIRPLPGKTRAGLLAAIFIEDLAARLEDRSSGNEAQVYDLGLEVEQRLHDLEQELQFTRENLQATIEELETANEELQATNEELLASNEIAKHKRGAAIGQRRTTYGQRRAPEQDYRIDRTHQRSGQLMASTRIATLFLDENLAYSAGSRPRSGASSRFWMATSVARSIICRTIWTYRLVRGHQGSSRNRRRAGTGSPHRGWRLVSDAGATLLCRGAHHRRVVLAFIDINLLGRPPAMR